MQCAVPPLPRRGRCGAPAVALRHRVRQEDDGEGVDVAKHSISGR